MKLKMKPKMKHHMTMFDHYPSSPLATADLTSIILQRAKHAVRIKTVSQNYAEIWNGLTLARPA